MKRFNSLVLLNGAVPGWRSATALHSHVDCLRNFIYLFPGPPGLDTAIGSVNKHPPRTGVSMNTGCLKGRDAFFVVTISSVVLLAVGCPETVFPASR